MTAVALGLEDLRRCPAGDANGDGAIAVDDLVIAVRHALEGCPAAVAGAAGPDSSVTTGGDLSPGAGRRLPA